MNTEKIMPKVFKQPDGRLIAVDPQDVAAMGENVQKMGQCILQLGQMMATMQKRMDELEELQAAVTISHADVKRLQAMIRARADELCEKYNLQDRESRKAFRAAIKKDLQKQYQVKDLHDLPAAGLPGAVNLIRRWVNIRLVMERRDGA